MTIVVALLLYQGSRTSTHAKRQCSTHAAKAPQQQHANIQQQQEQKQVQGQELEQEQGCMDRGGCSDDITDTVAETSETTQVHATVNHQIIMLHDSMQRFETMQSTTSCIDLRRHA